MATPIPEQVQEDEEITDEEINHFSLSVNEDDVAEAECQINEDLKENESEEISKPELYQYGAIHLVNNHNDGVEYDVFTSSGTLTA